MSILTLTINNTPFYFIDLTNGVIKSTKDKAEARVFGSKDEANQFAKQDVSTINWKAQLI